MFRSWYDSGCTPQRYPFKRLFFALPVSDVQRRALAQWRHGLGLRSGKPVPVANFHVTLLFVGDVEAAQVPAICAAVDQLALPATAPRLLLDRLQVWQRASALVLEAQQTLRRCCNWCTACSKRCCH